MSHGRVFVWAGLALALAVGAVLRLDAVDSRYGPDSHQSSDVQRYYVGTADSFLAGRGWNPDLPSNFIPPPLQAAFIVAAKWIYPDVSYGTLRTLQALFSTLSIGLAFWIGVEMGGLGVGLAAAWLLALDPGVIKWVGILLAETHYFFLLFAFLGTLLVALRRRSPRWMAASGVLLGLASLAKSFPMLLVFAIPSFCIARSRERRSWVLAAVFPLAFALVVGPWIAHNALRYGHLYPISTNSGQLLAQSNFLELDAAETLYWEDARKLEGWKSAEIRQRFEGRLDRDGRREWNERDRAYRAHFFAYVAAHPLHFLRNYVIKLGNVFRYPPGGLRLTVALLGLVGLAWFGVAERGEPRWVMFWVAIYFVGFAALFHVDVRGRVNLPVKVLMSFFAAYLFGRLAERARRRLRTAAPPSQST